MLNKYYSLDECGNKDKVYDYLDTLEEDRKITYEVLDDDVLKIKDIGLTQKETKALLNFFESNDVLVYTDIEDDDDYEEDEDYDDGDYDF